MNMINDHDMKMTFPTTPRTTPTPKRFPYCDVTDIVRAVLNSSMNSKQLEIDFSLPNGWARASR